ncbi:rhomboid family intramembrane serine protease [Kaistia dalseonensis]|uniref:Membrane associated rhomboid family serine protease n=1 Tax=Kaistia dalseonensis TaxID=410840 RepID=A0ABU0HCT2_9HYPH|nr:rhomboid family intramembrane serine protease [Kaistia dalseonensis]MCX5496930.1 rhomboid family intramembrane serine protease [Kaistia dalseonensis]MDQ0439555.1 membrane associated rhomboid family serine protease [Kaistia dalseonensis]
MSQRSERAAREPVFNLPPVIIATLAVLALVHAVRTYLLTSDQDGWVLVTFAFIPIRITAPQMVGLDWPGGLAGSVWSFVTYAFLHGDWMHYGVNALWLAAFGTPLARRFGWLRFTLFSLAGAAAGAAAHLLLAPHSVVPLVGASAAISAQMAASARFAFSPGARLGGGLARYDADFRPALSIMEMVRDRRVVTFLAVWFVFNLLFGLIFVPPGVETGQIAWESHIGGFLAGLLLFPLFDPVSRRGSSFS